jgi:hypothetical protein
MTPDPQNEIRKASFIGRVLSLEAFLMLMGAASLAYGIINDSAMNIFWGIVIIPSVCVLYKVRKKDWTKHWQDMETERKRREEFDTK